jgi:hypothetical protein
MYTYLTPFISVLCSLLESVQYCELGFDCVDEHVICLQRAFNPSCLVVNCRSARSRTHVGLRADPVEALLRLLVPHHGLFLKLPRFFLDFLHFLFLSHLFVIYELLELLFFILLCIVLLLCGIFLIFQELHSLPFLSALP